MAPKLDLRTKQPVAPPPVAAGFAGLPPVPGNGLPLPVGQPLKLSPDEEAQLAQLGWAPGQPVPDVAAAIEQVRRDAAMAPLPDPNMPRVSIPAEIRVEDMTPEARAAVMRNMTTMIEADKRLGAMQRYQTDDPSSPDVNNAIEKLVGGQADFEVTIGGPRPPATPNDTPPTPAESPPDQMLTAAPAQVYVCDNCNHSSKDDTIEVTDDDRRNFLAMLVGGAPRFLKEYSLFGGNLIVTFKSLTQAELDMAVQQAGCDDRDGLVPNLGEFMRRSQNYEMTLAIHSLKTPVKNTPFAEIGDVAVDEMVPGQKMQTPLKAYGPYVMEAIGSASLLRVINANYNRFYALMRRMEANMHNADFWKGTVLPS